MTDLTKAERDKLRAMYIPEGERAEVIVRLLDALDAKDTEIKAQHDEHIARYSESLRYQERASAAERERDDLKAKLTVAESENYRWTVLIHDLQTENEMLRKANLAGKPAFLREVDTASRKEADDLKAKLKAAAERVRPLLTVLITAEDAFRGLPDTPYIPAERAVLAKFFGRAVIDARAALAATAGEGTE